MRLLPRGAGDAPPPHPLRAAGLLAILGLLAPASHAGARALPDGFGPIRFGMSVEEVRGLRPDLAAEAGTSPAPALELRAPLVLERFELTGEEVLGLRPCRVGLHFANDRLYQLDFRCRRPGEEIRRALLGAFGPAREAVGRYAVWLTRTRAVTVDPETFRFSFTDRVADGQVQRFLLARALEAGLRPVEAGGRGTTGGEPPGPGTPAPGPAAGSGAGPGEGEGERPPAKAVTAGADTPTAPDRSWFVDPERSRELVVRLRPEAPRDEKLGILAELSVVGTEEAARALEPLLRADDELLFEGAVQALEDLSRPAAVAVLGEALADRSLPPARRLRVVEALGWLGRRHDVVGPLVPGLGDPDPEVRREVAMTLAVLRSAAGTAPLREALAREGDPETRRILARALEVIGDAAAAPAPPAGVGGPPEAARGDG